MQDVVMRHKAIGTIGKIALSIGRDNTDRKVFKFDVLDEAARDRAAAEIRTAFPGLDTEERKAVLSAELMRIANDIIEGPDGGGRPEHGDTQDDSDAQLAAMPESVRAEAEAMLSGPELLKAVINDVAELGVAGERELIMSIYLVGISRLQQKPLAAIVQGPSSSGKSYLIERTAALFPPETVIQATQMTPQALFHMPAGSLRHKFIVAGERSRMENDDRAEATRALREMISGGRLSKLMPVKMNGGIETMRIEQEGPIAFVESTTLTNIFNEDANRCILLHTDERPAQTRRIVGQLAEAYSGERPIGMEAAIIQKHYALQRMLSKMGVVVPYAGRLAERFTCDRVEARRAFPQLMSMIQASALLHQRQRAVDHDGRVVATEDDYQLALHLLAGPLGSGVSAPAQRFHERLQTWAQGLTFNSREAKGYEQGSKSSVYGWLNELHEAGLVEQVEPGRGKIPAKWRLNETDQTQPDGADLPTVACLFPELARTSVQELQLVG